MARFFTIAPRIYYKYGSTPLCIRELVEQDERKRFMIIAPSAVINASIANHVASFVVNNGAEYFTHAVLEDTCTQAAIDNVLASAASFNPDCIISLGGGSIISLGKLAWKAMSENSEIRRNPTIYNVAMPTTSGSGAEVTPFAVKIVDGKEVTINDISMVPHMSICDPVWSMNLSKHLTARAAIHAASNAVEASLSKYCSDYVLPFAVGSLRIISENLKVVLANNEDVRGREHLVNAAMMAGIAHANLEAPGAVHTLLSKLRSVFGVSYGTGAAVVVAPLATEVVKSLDAERAEFIADGYDTPEKMIAQFTTVVADAGVLTSRKAFGEMTEEEYATKVEAVVADWTCEDVSAETVKAILMAA